MLRRVLVVIITLWIADLCQGQPLADSVYYVDSHVPGIMTLEHKPMRAGVDLSYGINFFDQGADSLPDGMSEGCDYIYAGEQGRSLQGGFHVEYPLWGDASPFSFLLSAGYRNIAGKLSYMTKHPVRDPVTHDITYDDVSTEVRHNSIGLSLSPGLVLEPSDHFRFTLQGELHYYFYRKYDKKQFYVTPGGRFESSIEGFTSERERLLEGRTETIEANAFNATFRSTLGYEVPLSSKLWAEPQIGVILPFFGVTPYWRAWRIEAGISLHYDLTPRFESVPVYNTVKVPRYVKREMPPPAKPKLKASISAVGIGSDGKESPVLRMAIEEVRSRNAYPVLTYVFFDENSSAIPSRYVQYRSATEAQRDFKGATIRENIDPLDLYREVLNLIGSRLKSNRAAKLTLIGSVANVGNEAGNTDLSRARAESVKRYLTSVWGISADRITIEAKLDPDKPSPNATEQGREENRRVEMVISEDAVTDPVTVLKTERLATPDRVKLLPSIELDSNADVKIKSIRGSVLAGERELIVIGDTRRNTTTWSVSEEDIRQFRDSLTLRLDITDDEGNKYVALGSLPITVAQNTTEKRERIERFSLILFDFDESKIEDKNARMIEKVAKSLPTLNAERITIVGHTDESGTEDYNDRLSKQRAEETRAALEQAATRAGVSLPPRILTDGLGSKEKLFDNRSPEGRFYSRTVNITVEKRQ
ncbi:MAG TPA: OmpA family protein [Candidatus Kapabacteria bacterium]|nr:OmpA family protein [Candidatus Kapabacteria bacterium]